ncbi:MAG: hypothetical protein MJE68_05665, partial [Proteobacteria bacterium]|nr:hypothetical protein [Pseudomonadota bacterium]
RRISPLLTQVIIFLQQPPCVFCGLSDHWFPEVQKLSHQEAERALRYLELLDSYATSQEENFKERSDTHHEDYAVDITDGISLPSFLPFYSSYVFSSIHNEAEDGIQEFDAKESQGDQESHGQQGSNHNGEKGGENDDKKAREGLPPWMMREVRDFFQDKISEQAFKQDLKFYKAHKNCMIMHIEQLRSRVGKCGVKRDFNSAMLSCNVQC